MCTYYNTYENTQRGKETAAKRFIHKLAANVGVATLLSFTENISALKTAVRLKNPKRCENNLNFVFLLRFSFSVDNSEVST